MDSNYSKGLDRREFYGTVMIRTIIQAVMGRPLAREYLIQEENRFYRVLAARWHINGEVQKWSWQKYRMVKKNIVAEMVELREYRDLTEFIAEFFEELV